ncbi:MAG: hypothetical protein OEQ29_20465 [Alphaproteobacteria bacterium]|nr:hypothetical protein [Alphaproteobacteria bacterium]
MLFFPLENAPLTILLRLAEVPEISDLGLADEVHDLKLAKSRTETAYVREAPAICDESREAAIGGIAEGASRYEVAAEVFHI